VLDSQEKELAVIEKQFKVGAIPRSTLLTQRNQVAQTRASIPALEKALAQADHQLSVYVGKLPSESGMPEFELTSLQLPQELPVSLASSLVRQRPDIRASEALLHEASAQVGVATANQYPQISLTGSYGTQALKTGQFFNGNSAYWSLGAGLTAPIFNAGSLSAKRRAAVAALEQADAQYRTTVLSAFQNVADSLRALDSDASTLKEQVEVESLARESMDLSTQQYRLGGISYLVLLDAERSYQQAHVALVQAQAARYSDTAALFQALGGGWWNQPALADAAAGASGAASATGATSEKNN
jgi:NodT family efflux transporter outer membrane factor (OMF) lipoprotein